MSFSKSEPQRRGPGLGDVVAFVVISITLILAIGIHILTPILALRWQRQPFVGVLLEHTLVINGPPEARWPGATTGLRNPDRILAINGRMVYDRRSLEAAMSSAPVGTLVRLTIERLNDDKTVTKHDVHVVLGTFPIPDLVIRFFIPYIVALCYLGMGIWVFVRRFRAHQARFFAIFCAGAATLMSTTFDMYSTHLLIRVWMAAFVLTSLSLVALAFSFFSTTLTWRRWGYWPFAVLGLGLLVWNQATLYGLDPRGYFIPWLFDYVLLALSIGIFVLTLIYILLRPFSHRTRLQMRAILIGVVISFTPSALWVISSVLGRLLSQAGLMVPFQPLTNFPPLIFFPIFTGYAIFRYQFLDTDRLFDSLYETSADVRNVLRNFSRELSTSLDLQFVLDRLLAAVGQVVAPRHAVVLVPSPEGLYEPAATWGNVDEAALKAIRLTRQDAVISRLQRDGENLLLQGDAARQAPLNADEWRRVESLGMALLMPLRVQDQLLGVLALGPRTTGNRYSSDDIVVLTTMVDQAAMAAANAQLYAQQAAQSHYLIDQTRRLTDILSFGNQLKSLDLDIVVQSTVDTVRDSLGFDLVTLSLSDENDPQRVHVVAWAGGENATWERLASTTFPLPEFDAMPGVRKLGYCYFGFAAGTSVQISSPRRPVVWEEGDQLYVPLTGNEGLLGYLIADHPRDGLRPMEGVLEVLEIFANQAAIAIQNANLYASIDRALDERLAELSMLQEIDRQINAKLDFQHVMNTTLDWAMRITMATAGTLALVSEDHQSLSIVAHRGYPAEMDAYWDEPWPLTEGIVGRVVRTGEPAMVQDTTQDADYVDVLVSVRSQLAVPVKRQEHVIGVISLESAEVDGFSADHIAFLLRLADHATIAIENAHLFDQAQLRVAELSALQQISLDLTSRLDLNAVLDSIVKNAQMLVLADQVALYLYDEHKDLLSFGSGLSTEGKQECPPFPIEENQLALTVAHRGEAIVIHDAENQPMIPSDRWPVHAIASIPLRADRVLGVFDVAFRQVHTFTSDELLVLNLLANQAAIAIKNAQLYAAVQQANEAKSEFVSIVAHELKVPMTSIRGYARLLTMGASGQLSEQQIEFVNVILNNVDRMTNLVSDLLDSARIQSGHIRLAPRPISVAKIANDSLNTVRTQIQARKHELVMDIPEGLPDVQADPGWITQVFANLLSNAYKYTPDGGRIRVWAEQRDSAESGEGRWVVCAVTDSGIGLQPEDRERLFQQFFRVRDPKVSGESGTGLGLSITRSIVELHGGRIWVESTYGQGSTFYFTLPVA